jgi:cob(I)alamin adenosyltransferase
MSIFYTRKGDDGTTGLLGDARVPKFSLRIDSIGTLDEANAALGLVRSQSCSNEIREIILKVQNHLYLMMSEVAATKDNAASFSKIDGETVSWLEEETDRISLKVTIPKEFIIPGDTVGGAFLALSRTIVRRAERRISELLNLSELVNYEILRYLNRLSSLCFVLEIYENNLIGKGNQTLVK